MPLSALLIFLLVTKIQRAAPCATGSRCSQRMLSTSSACSSSGGRTPGWGDVPEHPCGIPFQWRMQDVTGSRGRLSSTSGLRWSSAGEGREQALPSYGLEGPWTNLSFISSADLFFFSCYADRTHLYHPIVAC